MNISSEFKTFFKSDKAFSTLGTVDRYDSTKLTSISEIIIDVTVTLSCLH